MNKQVDIQDVTPRDGDQTFGIGMSAAVKLWFVEHDRQMGIPLVEAGFPGSNDVDRTVFAHLRDHPPADIAYAAFGMTRRKSTRADEDPLLKELLRCGAPILTLVGKASRLQVAQALHTTPEENLAMVGESFAFLRSQGVPHLRFDAEHFFDGFKEHPEYALSVLQAAVRGGAERLILCDTNGYATPERVQRAVEEVRRAFADRVIGIHPHNDRDLAIANALAAVDAGAGHVDATWNRLGERSGNADLTSLIPNLHLQGYRTIPEDRLALLTSASEEAARRTCVTRHPSQPFVGRNAFAHKGGMHAAAVARDPRNYEGSPPETWGNRRVIVGSKQAGLSNVRALAEGSRLLSQTLKQRILRDSSLQQRVLNAIEAKEAAGFCMDHADASLELLMLRALEEFKPQICILSSEVHSTLSVHNPGDISAEMQKGGEKSTRAIVSVRVNGDTEAFDTVAKDDGPIGALCEALLKGLKDRFPFLPDTVGLLNYRLATSEQSKEGTHSIVQVEVDWTDGRHQWTTTGVSHNSIDAGWQAVVDAMEYKVQLERIQSDPMVADAASP